MSSHHAIPSISRHAANSPRLYPSNLVGKQYTGGGKVQWLNEIFNDAQATMLLFNCFVYFIFWIGGLALEFCTLCLDINETGLERR
jgi:hypothetical protein